MRKLFGCCLSIIITIAIFFGIIFGGVWYVTGKTLGELGLGDQVLTEGKTVEDLGLADLRIRDILSFLWQLRTGANESDIVTHSFSDDDFNSAKMKLEGSNIYNDETGEIDFENMDDGFVIFSNSSPITFKDTELAALFNLILTDGINEAQNTEFQLTVREVKLTVQENGVSMRTVLKYDISAINHQVENEIPPFLRNFIKLGDAIYIITNSEIYADEEGRIKRGQEHSVKFNNIPNNISDPIMNLLINVLLAENEFDDLDGVELKPSPGFFAEMMSGVFAEFIYRFGLVGEDEENLGNIGFGVEGNGGSVTIVPWTIDTVPVNDNYLNDAMYDAVGAIGARYYQIAEAYRYKVNETVYMIAQQTPQGFVDDINFHEGTNFVLGTAPQEGQVVLNVIVDGSDFIINGIYLDFGPYNCNIITIFDSELYPNMYNTIITEKDEFVYGEDFTKKEIDELVAEIISESVFYTVAHISLLANDDYLSFVEVSDLLNYINMTYNLNIIEGSNPSDNRSSAVLISIDTNGKFVYGFASVTTKYGTATKTYNLF